MANKTEMKHISHEHPLILNEVYNAREGDVCFLCNEEIVSCRSFVYSCNNTSSTHSKSSCAKFLLHKSCAELPRTIKHPNHHDVSLDLYSGLQNYNQLHCSVCGWHESFTGNYFRKFIYSTGYTSALDVCIRCGMESVRLRSSSSSSIYHPAHPQHALEFVDHLSSFKCHACKVDDNIRDLSYICTKCLFWIHKSCADAPASFQFQFHDKHPLQLSFSLPQLYQKFHQHCRICSKQLQPREWLYYCPKCRHFAHFHCARSNEKIRLIEDEIYDSEVVHLPAADESSADQLAEQFVMAMSTIVITTNNCFRHPAHEEHDLQLMTINELNNQKHDDALLLLLCDGCVKPIRTDHDHDNKYQFYGCVPCKFFMHKACAGFPREIDQHHLIHPAAAGTRLYADYSFCSSLDFFKCFGCGVYTNGIAFDDGEYRFRKVHFGCLTLPKKIKHEAHNHQLDKVFTDKHACKACPDTVWNRYKYFCKKCGYYICAGCIMKPKTIKHPWDPHPLSLIYDPGMVSSDHEHEFECEYCSKEIDCTNRWFYHCSECDLSFHLLDDRGYFSCFEQSSYSQFSSIKFGATVIIEKLHHHSLTYVFNKKVRRCEKCFSNTVDVPVLECVPCKVIFCWTCLWNMREEYNIKSRN